MGLKRVTLERDWGEHKKGATVLVDPARAETLKRDGYLDKPKPRRRTKKKKGG